MHIVRQKPLLQVASSIHLSVFHQVRDMGFYTERNRPSQSTVFASRIIVGGIRVGNGLKREKNWGSRKGGLRIYRDVDVYRCGDPTRGKPTLVKEQ